MKIKILILLVFVIQLFQSQNIEKIEFEHSNSIITGKGIKITIAPIRNNTKGKAKLAINKDGEEYTLRISREKFVNISNAIQKIKNDTIAVLDSYFDVSSSSITTNDNQQNKKSYYATHLTKNSQYCEKQKDFWYAAKLIIEAAKLRMEDLIGY
ncbi:hypothetical protein [Epilithonimonas hispanica]|uniref:Uncharacterized protein n=1 Tax=Epilithonimonas hispanica TaxID=358687 RepID=A0A3D9D1J5_9FLAO|nr:hypothetical protein [Epilithonimonas hispanica]REC71883.1 hypothetical protein DRF58_04410 [Epilithonimonas hispanica]